MLSSVFHNVGKFLLSQSVSTLGKLLPRLQVLLRVEPAHLLHEVLQDRLLAVLRSIYLYCGNEGDGGTQTLRLLSRLLVKLQSLA